MVDVAASSLPEFDTSPERFTRFERHTELKSVSSPRNPAGAATQSVSSELDPLYPAILIRTAELEGCVEPRSVPSEKLLESSAEVGQEMLLDLQQSSKSLQGNDVASTPFYRGLVSNDTVTEPVIQEDSMPNSFPELQQPKSHLAQPILTSLSPPISPLESPRSLTPPFPDDSDTPQVPKPTLLLEPMGNEFGTLLGPGSLSDRRRHSSAALSPTAETGGLLLPVQFPEQRRYSLVDSGPIAGLGSGRRTVSDVGQDAFVPPSQRRSRINNHAGDMESASTSRSGSRPATARISTFAEMGIQSFAMAKGEKTVDTAKKGKRNLKEAKAKRMKGGGAKKSMDEREKKSPEGVNKVSGEGEEVNTSVREPEVTEAKLDGDEVERGMGKGKMKRGHGAKAKQKDCVIM